MSFYREIGLLMLGTRLKRISDKFFQEMAQIYREQNIKFEIPWFPVLYLLLKEGSISMTEISKDWSKSFCHQSDRDQYAKNKNWSELPVMAQMQEENY